MSEHTGLAAALGQSISQSDDGDVGSGGDVTATATDVTATATATASAIDVPADPNMPTATAEFVAETLPKQQTDQGYLPAREIIHSLTKHTDQNNRQVYFNHLAREIIHSLTKQFDD